MPRSAFLAIVLFVAAIVRPAFGADVSVGGHYRRDGTYVQPHMRSAPDGNRLNNWSTEGNVNPYTGKEGHVNPWTPRQAPSWGGGDDNENRNLGSGAGRGRNRW